MNIFKAMKPDTVVDSVKSIDIQDLRSRGINTLLLDFDNTLGPDHATEPTDFNMECVEVFRKQGFKLC
ncbi:MAG: hypothetical protein IKH76_04335, partial [Clostridiales bacterium]|nr:hypothetical protein [Clostridiales bacterium]